MEEDKEFSMKELEYEIEDEEDALEALRMINNWEDPDGGRELWEETAHEKADQVLLALVSDEVEEEWRKIPKWFV